MLRVQGYLELRLQVGLTRLVVTRPLAQLRTTGMKHISGQEVKTIRSLAPKPSIMNILFCYSNLELHTQVANRPSPGITKQPRSNTHSASHPINQSNKRSVKHSKINRRPNDPSNRQTLSHAPKESDPKDMLLNRKA